MICSQVYDALMRVEQGDAGVDSGAVKKLMGMGLLNEVGLSSPNEADILRLREELLAASRERTQLVDPGFSVLPQGLMVKRRNDESKEKRIAFLDSKTRELRGRILELAAQGAAANALALPGGARVQISFAGREAMHNIAPRLGRVAGLEYAAFQGQMASLEKSFASRGERARRLLKKLSPKFKGTEEIHLRSAVVGLSALPNPDDDIIASFSENMKRMEPHFHKENRVVAAESMTLVSLAGGPAQDVQALVAMKDALYGMPFGRYDTSNSVEKAATMLWTYAGERRGEVVGYMDGLNSSVKAAGIIPLVILGLEVAEGDAPEEVVRRYNDFLSVIDSCAKGEGSLDDRSSAAALLAASEADFETLKERFRVASALMDQFFLSRLDSASAMVAVMGQEVAETIDNIRLASSVIMRSKLSLSGLENFSLGLKLVFHAGALIQVAGATSSIVRTEAAPEALNLTLLVPVRVGVPWLIFHDNAVHARAVRDYRFHPVHSHYVYG